MELEIPEVISVGAEWDALTDLPARATKFCPYWMTLVHESDARTAIVEKRCGSWWHRDCAEPRAARTLERLCKLISPLSAVYVALEDYDSDLLGRVRERRSRKGGEGVNIRRGDKLHLYSTIPLSGRKPPTLWIEVTPTAALELLAFQSLRLPGLGTRVEHGPFGWSSGWQLRKYRVDATEEARDKEPSGWKWAGSNSYEDMQRALSRTARKAMVHFRVKFTPGVIPHFWNWRPPPGVPPEWWRDTLGEELNRDDL